MNQVLNTLYVTTPGAYLRLEGETVCVMIEDKKRLQLPLHPIGAIVCFGGAAVSPALMAKCAEDGRSLIWMSRTGRFQARLEGPVSGNILLRVSQHQLARDSAASAEIARAMLAGKLRNSRTLIVRAARDARSESDRTHLLNCAQQLRASLRGLRACSTLDAMRGHEGSAALQYFQALNNCVRADRRADFAFVTRSRRPPMDRLNALLSFVYALLLNDCVSALEAVGLDPQLGFLHTLRPGRPALALDLMEEFRAPLGDRLAVTLINLGQLTPDDFERRETGAVLLNENGRRAVIAAYQTRKGETLEHPVLAQPLQIYLLIMIQARFMARVVRGDMPAYVPFLSRG